MTRTYCNCCCFISRDPIFITYIPKFVPMAIRKCLKVGHPTREDHPACAYAALDFDTDEEFAGFFGRFRIILMEALRLVKAESPALVFQHAEVWLKKVVSSPNTVDKAEVARRCSELEAVAVVLDTLFAKPALCDSHMDLLEGPATELARLCLSCQSEDPTYVSSLLSCLSSLFPGVGRRPGK